MNNGWGKRIGNPGLGLFSGSLRPPETTRDRSQTKRGLWQDCDMIQHRPCLGYTYWVSDGLETSSDFLGLITDFLRQLWPIFLFSFAWWVGTRSGIKSRPPGIKTKPTCYLQSQEVSETGIFVGRGDSGSVTVVKNIKHVLFLIRPQKIQTDSRRLSGTLYFWKQITKKP